MAGVDRLDDLVVHPRFQDLLPFLHHGVRSHGDDRQRLETGIAPDESGRLVAVHLRHLDIHQHQIETLAPFNHHPHRFAAVNRHLDQSTGPAEEAAGELPVDLVILHQQDAHPCQVLPRRTRRRPHTIPLLRTFSPDTEPDREAEDAADPRFALRFDSPAHEFDQLPGDGEPEPGAAKSASGGAVPLGKGLKKARQGFRGEPDAGVAHRET